MRFLPEDLKGDPLGILLLPFKAYLALAIICLIAWRVITPGHGGLAASGPVMLGYMICAAVFGVAAVIRFVTHRREMVAETLFFAAVAIIISLFIGPWTVT
jgi:hypothetical protein